MSFIEPDIDFIKHLKKDCGSALTTCMQCGNCTAVCDLSPKNNPFPRKEMIWASWGLKEKLLGDPDIWLCHQCGDCSATCPRDIRPGDVIASIRNYCYQHYARPRFVGKIMQKPAFLPLIIGFPVLVISVILLLAGTLKIPEGPVMYSKFFPHGLLNISFLLLVLASFSGFVIGLKQYWENLKHSATVTKPDGTLLPGFFSVLYTILTHKDFRTCTANRYRFWAHFMVFWGFVLLLAVTFYAILATLFFEYPMGFWNPVKILGNIAGLFLLLGCSIMIWQRIIDKEMRANSNYSDWLFIISLSLLTVSGLIVEIARFQNWSYAYHLYFVHLVLVWMVIMYIPYTKFAHFLYRTLAMTYSKYLGRI